MKSVFKSFLTYMLLLFSGAMAAQEITVVTEHFPPYQTIEKGRLQGGLSVDILDALLAETGVRADIQIYPWARAYQTALTEKNVLILTLARSPLREESFKWIGPTFSSEAYFWRLTSRNDIVLSEVKDALDYKVAVPKNDHQHLFLKTLGFSEERNLYLVTEHKQSMRMLFRGRVDLIMANELMLQHHLNELGESIHRLTPLLRIGRPSSGLSFAFSQSTPDDMVQRFELAFQKIIASGELDAIIQKWHAESIRIRYPSDDK